MSTARIQQQLLNDEVDQLIATDQLRDMQEIEEKTAELRSTMADLARMAAEQQIDLDEIDRNITAAAQNSEAGIKHLENASKRTNRKRWFSAISVGILAVGAGLLGGYPLGMALGYSGLAATLCGFGIIAGVILAVGLVSFGIYALVHFIKSSRDHHTPYDAPAPRPDITPVKKTSNEQLIPTPTLNGGFNTNTVKLLQKGMELKAKLG